MLIFLSIIAFVCSVVLQTKEDGLVIENQNLVLNIRWRGLEGKITVDFLNDEQAIIQNQTFTRGPQGIVMTTKSEDSQNEIVNPNVIYSDAKTLNLYLYNFEDFEIAQIPKMQDNITDPQSARVFKENEP